MSASSAGSTMPVSGQLSELKKQAETQGIGDSFTQGLQNLIGVKTKQPKKLQETQANKTDKIKKQEYAAAKHSMLGDLSHEVNPTCQQCVANVKAATRKKRKKLIALASVKCPDKKATAEQLLKDMDEVENMRCAKHVYLKNEEPVSDLGKSPPPGFKEPTDDDLKAMGLTKNALEPENEEFRAAVYMKDPAVWGENPDPKSVIAFRGSTPADEDWKNNFDQNVNAKSIYYERAVQIGNKLALKNANTHIVGHSLGGGLASAAQGGSGLTASTYNSAGLHPKTVARYSDDVLHTQADEKKINAIRLKGEVLTGTQEGLSFTSPFSEKAVGIKRDLTPSTDKTEFKALKKEGLVSDEEDYQGYLHGMDQVIDSMEEQKKQAESELAKC